MENNADKNDKPVKLLKEKYVFEVVRDNTIYYLDVYADNELNAHLKAASTVNPFSLKTGTIVSCTLLNRIKV